jgi:hypothetical protein
MGTEQLGVIVSDRGAFRFLVQMLSPDEAVKCIVVGASFIDFQLDQLFANALVKGKTSETLLGFRGQLDELMAKADMAYCLGFITKTCYSNIKTIAEIRNMTAHDFRHSTFLTSEISGRCEQLTLPAGRLGAALDSLWPDDAPFLPDDPGHRFRKAALAVFMDLATLTTIQVRAERLNGDRDLWH